MKAVVLEAYGSPEALALRDVDRPEPKAGEILVRVHATTVTRGDTELRALDMPWLFRIPLRLWLGMVRPKPNMILGMELAGVVESVGPGVEGFSPGDAVFGAADMGFGAYAEYACLPVEGLVAHKPEGVSFAQAAPISIGALAALGYLTKGGVGRGKNVLVRGASGSIGSYAVQLAKHFGAHVTGVCPPQGVERVRQLGADAVIDYTKEDFTQSPKTYDLILDVVGGMSIARCMGSLSDAGRYVRATIPGIWEVLRALWVAATSRKRMVLGDAGGSSDDLTFLAGLVDSGELVSVIDRRYGLDQLPAAHRYVEQGHKQGNVVITVVPAASPRRHE